MPPELVTSRSAQDFTNLNQISKAPKSLPNRTHEYLSLDISGYTDSMVSTFKQSTPTGKTNQSIDLKTPITQGLTGNELRGIRRIDSGKDFLPTGNILISPQGRQKPSPNTTMQRSPLQQSEEKTNSSFNHECLFDISKGDIEKFEKDSEMQHVMRMLNPPRIHETLQIFSKSHSRAKKLGS
jgi:hypothetical protein